MPIYNLLQPNIDVETIVLHVDKSDNAYNELERIAGLFYPIVKLRNTTFHYTAIRRLELSVGQMFLPSLQVTIEDSRQQFVDTDYVVKDDIITVYMGNSADTTHMPIHMTFKVLSVDRAGKGKLQIMATCVVPNYNDRQYSLLCHDTSFNAVKQLCSELQLGLDSNFKSTNDKRKWQYAGRTKLEMLQYIISNMYTDEASCVYAYIDQYYKLNVINLTDIFTESAIEIVVDKNLLDFAELAEPEKIKLTTSYKDTEHTQFKIVKWKPTNNTGRVAQNLSTAINHVAFVKDYSNNTINIDSAISKISDASNADDVDVFATIDAAKTVDVYSTLHADNSLPIQPQKVARRNAVTQQMMLNSIYLTVELQTFNNMLKLFTTVPVEIKYAPTKHDIVLEDSDEYLETNNEVIATPSDDKNHPTFCGDYVITGMSISYTKRVTQLSQQLRLHKRMWTKPTLTV